MSATKSRLTRLNGMVAFRKTIQALVGMVQKEHFMGLSKKKRPKYGYSTGVIIDGQSWIENKDGNLSGTATYRMSNTRFYSSKKAAMKHAEEIAACFPDSKKAKPFVGSYRFDK